MCCASLPKAEVISGNFHKDVQSDRCKSAAEDNRVVYKAILDKKNSDILLDEYWLLMYFLLILLTIGYAVPFSTVDKTENRPNLFRMIWRSAMKTSHIL